MSFEYIVHSGKSLDSPAILIIRQEDVLLINQGKTSIDFSGNCLKTNSGYSNIALHGSTTNPTFTIDDLLSEIIFELDYPLNWEKFYTGTSQSFSNGLLLPIKPAYFRFFTFNDLKRNLQIIVRESSEGTIYILQLKIPIQTNVNTEMITFEIEYKRYENIHDMVYGKGAILNIRLYMGFYPFFRLGKIDDDSGIFQPNTFSIYNDFYKTLVYYEDSLEVACRFMKYNLNTDIVSALPFNENNVPPTRTRKEENWGYITDYYELSNPLSKTGRDLTYDFIHLTIRHTHFPSPVDAVVLPMMYTFNLSDTYQDSYLAFDAGTAHSFVAYAKQQALPEPFSSTYRHRVTGCIDVQMVMLHKPSDDVDLSGSEKYDFNLKVANRCLSALLNEFMPSIIDDKSQFRFPIKSVICWDSDVDISDISQLSLLGNINIPFAFGIKPPRKKDRISTKITLDDSNLFDRATRNQIYFFLKQIVLMSRNMLLLKECDPWRTLLTWCRPTDISNAVAVTYQSMWEELYAEYFTKNRIKEGWENRYSLGKNRGLKMIYTPAASFFAIAYSNVGCCLHVEINAEYTDLVVFQDMEVAITSHFSFSEKSLFGNGLDPKKVGQDNGFSKKYSDIMQNFLSHNQWDEQEIILANLLKNKSMRSEDLVNFFLTIGEYRGYLKKDKFLKVLLLMHNTAIFYHAAQMMKNLHIGFPKNIGLAGNGSHIFELTNGSSVLNEKGGLAEVVTHVFKKIFNKNDNHRKIVFTYSEKPRECPAFGAILGAERLKGDYNEQSVIALGDDSTFFLRSRVKKNSYAELLNDDKLLTTVSENVFSFFEYFFGELWTECNFCENFLVSPDLDPQKLRNYVCDVTEIKNCIRSGIEFRNQDNEDD